MNTGIDFKNGQSSDQNKGSNNTSRYTKYPNTTSKLTIKSNGNIRAIIRLELDPFGKDLTYLMKSWSDK